MTRFHLRSSSDGDGGVRWEEDRLCLGWVGPERKAGFGQHSAGRERVWSRDQLRVSAYLFELEHFETLIFVCSNIGIKINFKYVMYWHFI